ncbi:hypothetical protein Trydic_g19266 [Trypoxylus dichotomus]
MVLCKCGKEFSTETDLKQQLRRRYCKYRPDSGESTTVDTRCTYCPRECKTFPGLRQHVRLAHPDAFNNELERLYEAPVRDPSRWSDVEIIAMAKYELRTVQAIKKEQLTVEYKELLESLKTAGALAKDIEEQVEEEAAAALPGSTIELVEESILQPNSSYLEAATLPRDFPEAAVSPYAPTVSGPAEMTPCSIPRGIFG